MINMSSQFLVNYKSLLWVGSPGINLLIPLLSAEIDPFYESKEFKNLLTTLSVSSKRLHSEPTKFYPFSLIFEFFF